MRHHSVLSAQLELVSQLLSAMFAMHCPSVVALLRLQFVSLQSVQHRSFVQVDDNTFPCMSPRCLHCTWFLDSNLRCHTISPAIPELHTISSYHTYLERIYEL